MYIKSILLDGFKSYGNKVEITGFDPEFNAITGLNGTGKSNILDSICFVLGITNLSNVRAGSLQELIYKHGQAGITKATVSITFDNRNKRQCPIGYENHDEIVVTRQVVMGGKNKYMINGINVQAKRINDLFCSVQLNVNNPHFLIMQGRITKVLNMKPQEILSMVEEAAGTRMYEAKKQAAQKTIEKKDAKLRELNEIISEDIAPKLQKLQEERAQFQEHQKVVRELENLTRLLVAWKYVTAEKKVKEAEAKVTEVQNKVQDLKDTIKSNENEIKDLDKQIAELNRKLDEESGNALKQLQGEQAAAERTEAAAGAAARAARDAAAAGERRGRALARSLDDDRAALAARRRAQHEANDTFSELRSASEAAEAELSRAQAAFLAVSTGQEASSSSLQDQLMEAKAAASEASTRIAQSSMERAHAQRRLAALEKEAAAASAAHRSAAAALGARGDELRRCQEELSRSTHDEGQLGALRERRQRAAAAARAARDAADRLAARLQRCHFRYTPPPAFDTSRVHGMICKLIKVKDPIYCRALETAAGGRLYNVVVDTEATSKVLLQRGQLQQRTTIVPLNKISGSVIDAATLRRAQEVGGGPENVQLALELVTYPAHVRPALAWALGGALVCRDLDVARRVTFHPAVRRRAVTLDGDATDPAGTLQGGAAPQGGSVLAELQQLEEAEGALRAAEEELRHLDRQLDAAQRRADQHAALQRRFEEAGHALEVEKARAAASPHGQLLEELEALKAQMDGLAAAEEQDKITQKETAAKARELEAKVKDIKGHREREFKKAEEELKRAKKRAEESSARWKLREQEFEALRLEVAELEAAVAASERAQRETELAGLQLQRDLRAAEDEHAAAAEAVERVQARVKRHKEELSRGGGAVARLAGRRQRLADDSAGRQLAVKELDFKVKEAQAEASDTAKKIRSLEAEHSWVSGERQYFGAAGGAYDFSGGAPDAARLAALTERRDRLCRGLNARAHTLLHKEEEQYQDLLRKKRIVEADRAKLVQVMAELDEKKRRTLVAACGQVNRDFGSIFSALLPGAQARLRPPPGRQVLDGLEVGVGFNDTWKESLGELSGGQRSLVALSLVLAMLLFKPAPLYILDEVDAALDLSHTQNIGIMLRNHFKHSQFLIVSLKDGMFNNANVLFRTRFVDGMSSVQRTVNTNR